MPSSPVFLTSSTLNINIPSTQGLILNKGEVVKGIIQEVKADGNLALLIQGKLLEAFSEVPVEKGQQVQLLVDDFREGRTYLKIMTPEGFNHLVEDKIVSSLKTMGVNSGSESLAMAKKLLQYNIPVTRETLSELGRGIKILGGFTPRNIEIAAVSMAGGAPTEPATLTALAHYFSGDTDLGRVFENLMQIFIEPEFSDDTPSGWPSGAIDLELVAVAAEKSAEDANSPTSPPSTSNNAQQVLNEKAVTFKTLLDKMAPAIPLSEIDKTVPTLSPSDSGLETTTMVVPRDQIPFPPTSLPEGIPSPTGDEPLKKQALVLLKDLLEVILIDSQDHSGDMASKMQKRPQETGELIKGLVVMKDMLKTLESRSAPVHELLGNLDRVEKEIAGQQAANSLGIKSGVQEQQGGVYYLSFPVQTGSQFQQVQMRVQRNDARPNLFEADHLSLAVALDTKNLGRVLFHVDWSRVKRIRIRGVVENNQVCQFLGNNLEGLLRTLRAMGYSVEDHGLKVCEAGEEQESLKWNLEEKPGDVRLWRVDITV
ncbi:MAG TPA: hypothetical protein VN426_16580 [Syntrophomonadaceae bacterium]|nr:hypothetical protein [Syntrophomonadaceae bacterium]